MSNKRAQLGKLPSKQFLRASMSYIIEMLEELTHRNIGATKPAAKPVEKLIEKSKEVKKDATKVVG